MVDPPLARTNTLEMRRLTLGDADAALDIYRQCEDFLALGPEPRASVAMVLADMEASRHENGIFCGIYKRDGSIIGVADFVPSGLDGRSDVAFLSLLMIAKPFRGQGYGSEVARLIERRVRRDHGATSIRTAVQVNNAGALRFWQSKRYKIIAGPDLQPDRTTVFQLEKGLAGETGKA